MDWDQMKSQLGWSLAMDLALNGVEMWVLHRMMKQPPPPPPTNINPGNLQDLGRAAVYSVVVGGKRKQVDEAIYASLISDSRITPRQRSIINDMLNLPEMVPHARYFRYIVALMQQVKTEDDAIDALKNVGDEPKPEDAMAAARGMGLLEPEEPTKVQQAIEKGFQAVGKAVKEAWDELNTAMADTSAADQAKKLFDEELGKLFKK